MTEEDKKVTYLPVWKKGATAHERLCELAQIAEQHPEQFARMAVVYEEDVPTPGESYPRCITRVVVAQVPVREAIGLLEQGKMHLYMNSLED